MDAALRVLVRSRARNRCEYCHLPQRFSELHFHIEHIIPKQHRGADESDNLALACPDCNLVKGPNLTGIDPDTSQIVRLFHPRLDKWAWHFAQDGARIVGKTSIGRATIELLRLNDEHRLSVRAFILGV